MGCGQHKSCYRYSPYTLQNECNENTCQFIMSFKPHEAAPVRTVVTSTSSLFDRGPIAGNIRQALKLAGPPDVPSDFDEPAPTGEGRLRSPRDSHKSMETEAEAEEEVENEPAHGKSATNGSSEVGPETNRQMGVTGRMGGGNQRQLDSVLTVNHRTSSGPDEVTFIVGGYAPANAFLALGFVTDPAAVSIVVHSQILDPNGPHYSIMKTPSQSMNPALVPAPLPW